MSFMLLNICIFELSYGPRHTKTAGYLRRSKAHRSFNLYTGVYYKEIPSALENKILKLIASIGYMILPEVLKS